MRRAEAEPAAGEPAAGPVAGMSYVARPCTGETYDTGATVPAGRSAELAVRVAEAVQAGAATWSEVARQAGCSRKWATRIGLAAGLALPQQPPARTAMLSVRVAGRALAALDAEAAARGQSRSETARRLLREALAGRAAP